MIVLASLIATLSIAAPEVQTTTTSSTTSTTTTTMAPAITKRQKARREAHYNMLIRRGIAPGNARAMVTKMYGGG
ncbi:MAG: hypothetical protein V4659_09105 [Pseudomonadota bacterium]